MSEFYLFLYILFICLEKSNIRKPVPKRKKHAVIIDLISDSDDDEDSTMSQSTKKQAIGISSSRFQTSCINSDEYETPELMIIDLQGMFKYKL